MYHFVRIKSRTLRRSVSWVQSSVAVLAEISLKSPRKLFIFVIKKHIYRIKISKINKLFNFETNFTDLNMLRMLQAEVVDDDTPELN